MKVKMLSNTGNGVVDSNADSNYELSDDSKLPELREVYWVCNACETDYRKYRDGYHKCSYFDEGHVKDHARDKPVCTECKSDDMTFTAIVKYRHEPLWDLEHQCWRLPSGEVYDSPDGVTAIHCPICCSYCEEPDGDGLYDCRHCGILIDISDLEETPIEVATNVSPL